MFHEHIADENGKELSLITTRAQWDSYKEKNHMDEKALYHYKYTYTKHIDVDNKITK